MGLADMVRQVDAFPKTLEEFRVRTSSGAAGMRINVSSCGAYGTGVDGVCVRVPQCHCAPCCAWCCCSFLKWDTT